MADTVIVVPGFLGSELSSGSSYGLYTPTVWLNPVNLLTGGFPRLRLAVPGEPSPPPPGPPLREGGPLPLYYGLLCGYLSSRGWRVVTPKADWRKPIMHDAANLAALIRSDSSLWPVRIVCHSRGGLVVRAALALLAETQQQTLVVGVVGIGVPHTGSLNTVPNLACWGSFKLLLERLGKYLPYVSPLSSGDVPVRQCLRSWPALYELMPAPGASWLEGVQASALYQPAVWFGSPLDPVASFLADALAAWGQLAGVPPALDWTDIAGVRLPTPIGVPDITRIVEPGSLTTTTQGDGNVPLLSAHPGSRRLVTTPASHDMLPNDGRTWPYIDAALRGQLAGDVAIQGPTLALP